MSVFNCNVNYKRVEGDSLTSTFNKLVSQGLIDSDYNILDNSRFYRANIELSSQASTILGIDVNLFTSPMSSTGRRAIPNSEAFNSLNEYNNGKNVTVPAEVQPVSVLVESSVDVVNDIKSIYSKLGKRQGSLLSQSEADSVKSEIDSFNNDNTNKELSIIETEVEDKYLIVETYKKNYLYDRGTENSEITEEKTYLPQSDNSDFNKQCIIG